MLKHPIRSFRDLQVYQLAFRYSVEVYDLVQHFPQGFDRYLAQQLLARSQAVRTNIAAAWGQRRDRTALINCLCAAQLEAAEVQIWIEAAIGVAYLDTEVGQDLGDGYRYLFATLDQLMASASLGAKRLEESEFSTLPATA
ncbi:MAG: four helix bundle protein [Cyanobacteria bacterium J06626_18]